MKRNVRYVCLFMLDIGSTFNTVSYFNVSSDPMVPRGITMILRKECTQAIEYDETQFRCRVSFIYPRQGERGNKF
jgi:hypothetical protein